MKVNRRELLKSATFFARCALFGILWRESKKLFAQDVLLNLPDLPSPKNSGIEHIVVVTMENRSFDHFLGWLPNADGQQSNSYPLPNGAGQANTYLLAPDYHGCGHPDPDHTYAGGRIEYAQGKMDGWLLDTANDEFSIGYYQATD